jgi:hypothetical protein
MAPNPTVDSIAAALTIPGRLLLSCLASDTDWQAASIAHATAQHMMVRGLIERHAGHALRADRAGARRAGGDD